MGRHAVASGGLHEGRAGLEAALPRACPFGAGRRGCRQQHSSMVVLDHTATRPGSGVTTLLACGSSGIHAAVAEGPGEGRKGSGGGSGIWGRRAQQGSSRRQSGPQAVYGGDVGFLALAGSSRWHVPRIRAWLGKQQRHLVGRLVSTRKAGGGLVGLCSRSVAMPGTLPGHPPSTSCGNERSCWWALTGRGSHCRPSCCR